jgi:hypothetical protein
MFRQLPPAFLIMRRPVAKMLEGRFSAMCTRYFQSISFICLSNSLMMHVLRLKEVLFDCGTLANIRCSSVDGQSFQSAGPPGSFWCPDVPVREEDERNPHAYRITVFGMVD